MDGQSSHAFRRIYVILNPVAGHSSVEQIREGLETFCRPLNWEYEVYETTGEEQVAEVAGRACQAGFDLVVAAGGDGTVSETLNGLVPHGIPLGILPVGTGNGLARALGLPLDPEGALQLFAGEHEIKVIDALEVAGKLYVLNVSAGISSRAMDNTEAEQKRKLGMLAYVQSIVQDLAKVEPLVFELDLDGLHVRVQAVEVLVSNGELLKGPALLFGSPEDFDDGRLNVNILTASSAGDYLRLAWDLVTSREEPKQHLHDLAVHDRIIITVDGPPQPVQADGELIGETPVEVRLRPKAVKVVVPKGGGTDAD